MYLECDPMSETMRIENPNNVFLSCLGPNFLSKRTALNLSNGKIDHVLVGITY